VVTENLKEFNAPRLINKSKKIIKKKSMKKQWKIIFLVLYLSLYTILYSYNVVEMEERFKLMNGLVKLIYPHTIIWKLLVIFGIDKLVKSIEKDLRVFFCF